MKLRDKMIEILEDKVQTSPFDVITGIGSAVMAIEDLLVEAGVPKEIFEIESEEEELE